MSDYNLNVLDLQVGICITPKTLNGGTRGDATFTIECNFCSLNDYMFYDGDRSGQTESGWLERAALHLAREHEEDMATWRETKYGR